MVKKCVLYRSDGLGVIVDKLKTAAYEERKCWINVLGLSVMLAVQQS